MQAGRQPLEGNYRRFIRGSSSGRTTDFDSVRRGSNPFPRENLTNKQQRYKISYMGLTESDIHCIVADYKSGKTLQQIATENGVSKQYIDQVLERAKVERRPKKKVTPEMESQIKDLAEAGKTYSEISESTGVSRSTVCVICKKLGIKHEAKEYVCRKCGGTRYRSNGKGKRCSACENKRAKENYQARKLAKKVTE